VLVEFAIIALVLYLLLAVTIEFGRIMYSAQATQQAADVGARELSKTPLPAGMTFEEALAHETVRNQVYSEDYLVLNLTELESQLQAGETVTEYLARKNAPVVNRMLLPIMIVDHIDDTTTLLRYPGRLVRNPYPHASAVIYPNAEANSGHWYVEIPLVAIAADGTETLGPTVQVFEEVKPTGQPEGPFRVNAASVPEWQRGMVALRINYPYQAAAMVAYPPQANDPPEPNVNREVVADPDAADPRFGPNAGTDGLGRLTATGKEVRPYRKVLTAQAFARREVFQPLPTP